MNKLPRTELEGRPLKELVFVVPEGRDDQEPPELPAPREEGGGEAETDRDLDVVNEGEADCLMLRLTLIDAVGREDEIDRSPLLGSAASVIC